MYSTTWIAAAVRSVLYASALSAGVLLCASSAHADDRDQLKSIQADIAARQRAIKQQQQQRASLLAQLKAQEEAIAAAARKLRETQDSLNQLNKQIDEMNAALAKLERQRASQERNLAAQLDAAFRQGPHTGIQMVLSGEEGQRNQRMQVYFSYFNQARQETIAELKKTREEMAVQKSMLEEKQSQQQTLVYEQKAQQAKLEQARNERKKTLSGLESSIQQGQQQLSELRANESRLRGRIAQAEAAAKARADREARDAQAVRDRQQEASRKGTTYKPTESERSLMSRTGGLGSPRGQAFWPVRGPLLHRYGEQLQGELRWKGMVIAASEGTEVRAIADGRVILADWLQGYGLVVVVEHGKGDMSLYGYNQSALVSVGTQVRAGQPIALVGSSGGQGRPSLYFEIRIHLPMAPLSKQPLEKDTLRPEMSSEEIERIIREAYGKVPYAVGLNNHMGSAMTSNLFGMQKVMQALERYNLYFLDSVTIGNTQAMRAAQGTGVKVIKRKVFLDDTQNEADIRNQFNRAIALARRNGSAIAIGHPHPTTVRVLQQMVYNLPPDITLVRPSSLLNEPQVDNSTPNYAQPPAQQTQQKPRNPFHGVKSCKPKRPLEPVNASRFFTILSDSISQSALIQYYRLKWQGWDNPGN